MLGQCRSIARQWRGKGGRGAPFPGLALSVPHRCGAESGEFKERGKGKAQASRGKPGAGVADCLTDVQIVTP